MRHPHRITRRAAVATAAAGLMAARWGSASAESDTPVDTWPVLTRQIFGAKPIGDDSSAIGLDAPDRALDAALVPVTIRLLSSPEKVRALTLVIDQNPSPLVARIAFGPDNSVNMIATRVRVNDYTNVHAVAERADGSLLAVDRFVKAAGGCSAPMVKEDADTIAMGTMRFRQFPPKPGSNTPEAELIIRHPNNSGMQMDQLTRLYIPAHYITSVKISQGDALLLAAETGISMSQNPEFRFSYRPNGAKFFRAEAVDNKGRHFSGEWPVTAAA